MSRVQTFPKPVDAPVDPRTADVLDMLADFQARARAGEFRSLTIVATSADGCSVPTAWSTANGDLFTLIGHLAVLQHDLMSQGRDG